MLGVHVETIRRLARSGKLRAFKVGRGWRIRMDALQKWADSLQRQSHKRSILIVVDDEQVRGVIRQMIHGRNCRVFEAVNGAEGLDIVAREKIDAIFLDLLMPVMNGPDFLHELREKSGAPPVTIISGHPDSDLMMEAASRGPVTLLVKPVKKRQVLQALQNMLGVTCDSDDSGADSIRTGT
ncbi:MAG: response regulator [Desulfobacterales bacterium]|nr:response regulator [Desulfobacterales bacterium]